MFSKKAKVVLVHTMQAHKCKSGISPLIQLYNEVSNKTKLYYV